MSTADDVVLNKVATIERCIGRVRQEVQRRPEHFCHQLLTAGRGSFNIQRACEADLDIFVS